MRRRGLGPRRTDHGCRARGNPRSTFRFDGPDPRSRRRGRSHPSGRGRAQVLRPSPRTGVCDRLSGRDHGSLRARPPSLRRAEVVKVGGRTGSSGPPSNRLGPPVGADWPVGRPWGGCVCPRKVHPDRPPTPAPGVHTRTDPRNFHTWENSRPEWTYDRHRPQGRPQTAGPLTDGRRPRGWTEGAPRAGREEEEVAGRRRRGPTSAPPRS